LLESSYPAGRVDRGVWSSRIRTCDGLRSKKRELPKVGVLRPSHAQGNAGRLEFTQVKWHNQARRAAKKDRSRL